MPYKIEQKFFWGPFSTFGLTLGAVIGIADQVLKWWILKVFELEAKGSVMITPFMDLVMVWNRGISFGLFQQDGQLGPILLAVLSLAAVIGLTWWLASMTSFIGAVGAGLVIGGAIGNGIDRLTYGAVADFVSLHAGGFYWYVFNIADAAIVIGAAGLMYESMVSGHNNVSKTS